MGEMSIASNYFNLMEREAIARLKLGFSMQEVSLISYFPFAVDVSLSPCLGKRHIKTHGHGHIHIDTQTDSHIHNKPWLNRSPFQLTKQSKQSSVYFSKEHPTSCDGVH